MASLASSIVARIGKSKRGQLQRLTRAATGALGCKHPNILLLSPKDAGPTPTAMSKYEPLTAYLRHRGDKRIEMDFNEIETVIGDKLPPSAFRHRAWWSNNPTNSTITDAWLSAGYESSEVDMAGQRLVFLGLNRVDEPLDPVKASVRPAVPRLPPSLHVAASTDAKSLAAQDNSLARYVLGSLKGTVTVSPGTDLTGPTDADWDLDAGPT